MSKKIFSLSWLLASGIALHAQSQWADTTKTATLDEVVVTANKFPQKQSTTGKVITVINREQIEKSSGKTVSQLLNEQAGITINGALNNLGTNQTVYMRGAASGRTLILIDGIPVNDPSTIDNSFDLNMLSLNNIDRIEIARGAQSTLNGSDAEAGVINIITTKNDISKPLNVKATIAGGKFSTYRAAAQVFGKADQFTYNVGYSRLQSKGFSSAYDSTGTKAFDNDGYKGNAANASIQYQPTKELSFSAFGRYSQYKTDLDYDKFKDEKDYNNTNKILSGGGSFHYTKNAVSITGKYQYTETTRKYFNDSTDNPGGFGFYTNDYFAKSQFAELFSNIELGKNVTLLQGADYRYSSMNNQFGSLSFPSSFPDTSFSQSSGYASLFVHDNQSKLNVELGGRMNVHSRYGNNGTYTFNPSYNFNKHYRVFGSIASGFKAPTLYQLYDAFAGSSTLKPERSTTYEFGVQQSAANISTRIVYFHRKIKDGLDFDNINYRYFNFYSQSVDGGELEVTARPVEGLSITANYSYIHPKEMNQSRLTQKDTTYTLLLRRPAHSANLTVGYKLMSNLLVSVGAKYVGKRYDAGGYDAVTFNPLPDFLLKDYLLLNAYAEYSPLKYLKVFADAQNITNKQFFEANGYNSIPFLINGGVVFNW